MTTEERRSGEDTLTLDSDLAELQRLHEFVEGFCGRAALPEQVCYHVSIVLEELAVNAVKHGHCDPRAGALIVKLRLEGGLLHIAFSDTGVPFNPLAAPAPDLSQGIGQRPVGGLGIHLVRCLMPEIRYERRQGRNCLLLSKPIEATAELTRQQGGTDAKRHGNCPR